MNSANEGLNRFCVADGISSAADRRDVPPNLLNGIVRPQEPLRAGTIRAIAVNFRLHGRSWR